MKIFCFLCLLIFASCQAKYDTSKGMEVISEPNIVTDYRLTNISNENANVFDVANIGDKEIEKYILVQSGTFMYNNGKIFTASNDELTIQNIDNNQKKIISHKVNNPKIFVSNDIVLLYNINGEFAFFDTKNDETKMDANFWNDNLKIQGLASNFVCNNEACYALTLQGEIITLNFNDMTKNIEKNFANQEMILNELYTPIIIDDKIVFAVGDSEFAIYDIYQKKIIEKQSFASENATVFDINIVKNIYNNSKSFVISYLNGIYGYSMFYARPLWQKDYVIKNALITENFIFFYNEKNEKLICLHLETGEVKWVKDAKYQPMLFNVDYNKNLLIMEKNGIHFLDIETGDEVFFKKSKINAEQSFVYNTKLYYKSGNKIFYVK